MFRTIVLYTYTYTYRHVADRCLVQCLVSHSSFALFGYGPFESWGTGCCWGLGRGTVSRLGIDLGF